MRVRMRDYAASEDRKRVCACVCVCVCVCVATNLVPGMKHFLYSFTVPCVFVNNTSQLPLFLL
jgi:chemotaxis receptor (MCP) glutamine deamidase CheD